MKMGKEELIENIKRVMENLIGIGREKGDDIREEKDIREKRERCLEKENGIVEKMEEINEIKDNVVERM